MLRRHFLHSLHAAALAAVAATAWWRPVQAQVARASEAAPAPRRLALVIGNARYADVPLNNPANDARLVAHTLSQLGFEVTLGIDLRRADFVQALLQFARQVPPGADVVFYYAGHALQLRGSNYLLPVDIRNLADADWVEQNAINLDGSAIRQLLHRDARRDGDATGARDHAGTRPGVRLLFIDACRDNPYAADTPRPPSLTAGLASVQGSANIDGGVLIASASQPNRPADDGPPGGNSAYTAHLVREMRVPGQNVETMLKRVAVSVDRESRQTQLPMFASSLTTEFVFSPELASTQAESRVQQVQPARSVQLEVRADTGLNGGADRRPRKSVLWVYVLRNPAAFQRAGFDALYERAETTLGPELLAREKLNLTPGERYSVPLDLAPGARAIGVLVAYRDAIGDGWKALLPLAPAPVEAQADAKTETAVDPPLPVRIDAGAQRVSIALAG
jgi:type VI secretion system VasD/TssJ family lipoprotein